MSKSPNEQTKLIIDDYTEQSSMDHYKQSWSYLFMCPKDIWLIYGVTFFQCSSFFTFVSCMPTYITDVRDVSDSNYGLLFSFVGGLGILYSLVFGNFGDRYGIRFTLILGTSLQALLHTLFIIFTNFYIQWAVLLFPGFLGIAIAYPALQCALKHYVPEQCISLAVSCFWSMYFLGSLLGGVIVQLFFLCFDKSISSYRLLFIYLSAMSVIATVLSLFIKDISPEGPDGKPRSLRTTAWQHTRELLILKRFWRLIGLVWLLVLIRSIFFYQTIVLPLYMDRDLGDDTYYGSMVILNQVIIIVITPLLSYSVYFLGPYDSFIAVGVVSGIAPLGFLFGPSYYTVVFFILASSVGEGLLTFRITDYALDLAPKGKESVMMAVTTVPLVFSIIISGGIGGFLMDGYCPDEGDRQCWKVWAIIAVIAIPPTVIMILFRSYIEDKRFEANPYVVCCKEAKEY